MPEEIHGNIEGIRKTVLDELKTLYDVQLEPDVFMPQDLLASLCGYSASMNREIALYITRYGEIADVFIGRSDSIDLPDLRLRRSEKRLSMIRCVHTHPCATGELSDVDISALRSMRFDAMCAVGVSEDGRPTSAQCAFLDEGSPSGYTSTELLNARRLPQEEWTRQIAEADAAYAGDEPASDGKRERAVLAYTDAMTRQIQVPEPVFAAVRALLDDRLMVELTATVAAYNMVSRFLEALQIHSHDNR